MDLMGQGESDDDNIALVMELLDIKCVPRSWDGSPSKESEEVKTLSEMLETEEDLRIKLEENMKELESHVEELQEQLKVSREKELNMESCMKLLTKEIRNMLSKLAVLSSWSVDNANIVKIGPFPDRKSIREYLKLMYEIGEDFLDNNQEVSRTQSQLGRINSILEDATGHTLDRCDTTETATAEVPLEGSTSKKTSQGIPKASSHRESEPHQIDMSKVNDGVFCVCGIKFKSKQSLDRHIREKTTSKGHSCSVCNRKFHYMKGLARHWRCNEVCHQRVLDLAASKKCNSLSGLDSETMQQLDQHGRNIGALEREEASDTTNGTVRSTSSFQQSSQPVSRLDSIYDFNE